MSAAGKCFKIKEIAGIKILSIEAKYSADSEKTMAVLVRGVIIYIKYFSCPQISRSESDCGECQVNYVVTTTPQRWARDDAVLQLYKP